MENRFLFFGFTFLGVSLNFFSLWLSNNSFLTAHFWCVESWSLWGFFLSIDSKENASIEVERFFGLMDPEEIHLIALFAYGLFFLPLDHYSLLCSEWLNLLAQQGKQGKTIKFTRQFWREQEGKRMVKQMIVNLCLLLALCFTPFLDFLI